MQEWRSGLQVLLEVVTMLPTLLRKRCRVIAHSTGPSPLFSSSSWMQHSHYAIPMQLAFVPQQHLQAKTIFVA